MKLKKKICGTVCLGLVALMTLCAHAVPDQKASATSGVTSVTDTITVTVYDKYASVIINNPLQDDIITDPYVDIDYDYSSTRAIHFELTHDGVVVDEWTDDGLDYMVPGHKQHRSNLDDFGDYVLTWEAAGAAPGLESEGSMSFKRYATKVVFVGFTDNNEPIFDITYLNDVKQLDIQIYDDAGNPLFQPVINYPSSTDTRYSVDGDAEQVTPYTKKIRIVVPMPDSAKTGDYIVGVSGYDEDGIQMGKDTYKDSESIDTFHYTAPDSPDVPNTGLFSGALNIAQSDFLITGLLIFFSAAIGGIFILNRKNNR